MQDGWFNSYYDNHGNAVEGITPEGVRMILTGQVFSIMSGTATNEQVEKIVRSADAYLYREEVGGYRLNTDFKERDIGHYIRYIANLSALIRVKFIREFRNTLMAGDVE